MNSSYTLETIARQRSAEVTRRIRSRGHLAQPTPRRRRIPRVEWQLPARAPRAAG